MLESLIANLAQASCRRPFLTVAVAAALTLLSTVYSYEHVAINTDIGQLISAGLPWRQNELRYDAAFPHQADTFLVVIDGTTPEAAEHAAGALANALAAAKGVQAVQELGGGAFFRQNGLLYLPLEKLRRTTEQLIRAQPLLGVLASDPTLRGFAAALGRLPEGARRGDIEIKELSGPLALLSKTIDALLDGRPAAFSWNALMTGEPPQPLELRRFVRVKPILDFDALQPGAAVAETIRAAARDLGLTPESGVSLRLTGPVAMADDEFATVADGALFNLLLTLAAVLLILWRALRSGRIIVAVVLNLFAGLAITSAAGLAMVGALNLISVAFAVLFVGIGVDFGIQFAVRYRRERHIDDNLGAALDATAASIAKPLALAGTATAASFYAFLPTDYVGVSELGLIAGTGMIVALVTSVTLLPALLMLLKPPPEPLAIGYRGLARVDAFMAAHRAPILLVAALAVAAGLPLLRALEFDFDPLSLRNARLESVATLLDLMKEPATTPNVINILSPSLAEADAVARRLSKLPEVADAVTLRDFVPEDQDEKLAIVADAEMLLSPTLSALDVKAPPSDTETRKALDGAAAALLTLTQEEKLTSGFGKSLKALAEADPARRTAIENALLGGFKLRLEQLRDSLHPQRISIDRMPEDLTRDWLTAKGEARIEARPKGERQDNEAMRRFAGAVLGIAPNATGAPILVQESAKTIVRAFIQGAALALISITLILLVALRRIGDVLVTLVPLLLAGAVTLELSVLFGLKLNFANIIALPLLLGVGVAFKIYYVLAWRNGETNFLASSLTRAALFSSMTTATAFASLWLSEHPGTSSMGKLLSLSLLTTLVAAVLFQPVLMGPPR